MGDWSTGIEIGVAVDAMEAATELMASLTQSGFRLREMPWDSPPDGLKPDRTLGAVVVWARPKENAIAFVRRLRAANTEAPVPVLWLVPDSADLRLAFEVADVATLQGLAEGPLVAQVNALLRIRDQTLRLSARGAEVRSAVEQLQKALGTLDREGKFAQAIPPLWSPEIEHYPGLHVVEHRVPRGGTQAWDATRTSTGELCLHLIAVSGIGPTFSSLMGSLMLLKLRMAVDRGSEPSSALEDLNRFLLANDLPGTAMISASVVRITEATGGVRAAFAGLPTPVQLPRTEPARVWHGSGSYLGVAPATYSAIVGNLQPGERLLLVAGIEAANLRPDVRAAADDHRQKPCSEMIRAILNEVQTMDSGLTLLAYERTQMLQH